MKRFCRFLSQPEFHVFIFLFFFVLVCLPFLLFYQNNQLFNMFNKNMFYYFFSVWGIVIVLLFLVSRALDDAPEMDPRTRDDGEHDA